MINYFSNMKISYFFVPTIPCILIPCRANSMHYHFECIDLHKEIHQMTDFSCACWRHTGGLSISHPPLMATSPHNTSANDSERATDITTAHISFLKMNALFTKTWDSTVKETTVF